MRRLDDVLASVYERDYVTPPLGDDELPRFETEEALDAAVAERQAAMKEAAIRLDFERAAALRDEIKRLRATGLGVSPGTTGRN